MGKINLERVTAICIDGRELNDQIKKSYTEVFRHMLSVATFYDFIFVSVTPIEFPGVNNITISNFDVGGYSNFCVKELNSIIKSDFCLVFQLDGFIINPDLWDDEFYSYDYIGAPWPLHFGGWVSENKQVGNGGFSLRSKKLLEITAQLPGTTNHEDTYIVFEHRKTLEQNNVNIAPVNVAIKFSVENPIDENHNIETSFGFHSKSLLRDVLHSKIIKQNV